MFIPLTWAAAIGMMHPILMARHPRAGAGLLVLILALFGYVASENVVYYETRFFEYHDAAVAYGASDWWPRLRQGERYCVVQMPYESLMMTGPTMSEYSIVDRSDPSLCPAGTVVVTADGIQAR